MASKKSLAVRVFFLSLSCFFASLVASLDTLNQGDKLNSSTYLVSARKIFTLGFYSPADSNSSYLGIWYTSDSARTPVWIGSRNTPIADKSGVLTIDNAGKLVITSKEGARIGLYGGQAGTNVTATLLDSGNFVMTKVNNNGSEKRLLWESFKYPMDTLLPGMKLGVNHRTGRRWTLTSGLAADLPASGAFTLEWDPAKRRLIVRNRGVIYWTSGVLGEKGFEFIETDVFNHNYKFINITTEDEEYFTYSLIQDPAFLPEERKVISGWLLNYEGQINDGDRPTIARVDICYGYNTDGGCELWEQPNCRNRYQKFDIRSGHFGDIDKASYQDDNLSLGLSDCRLKCWNDCDCVGFLASGTGCVFWTKDLEFHQDYSGSEPKHYVLISDQPQPPHEVKAWVWIVIAVAISLLMLILAALCRLRMRKRRLEEERKRRKEYLRELVASDSLKNESDEQDEGMEGHDLKILSFASIVEATDNFSIENKLGQDGFGPVYKGKLQEGQEIAVKRLSRTSGQGLVEFKNELILIAKLQHTNLVQVLGYCIHGEEKMLIYEYLPNKSLDFFLFDPTKRELLDWKKRLNIIEGFAQGMLYLHRYSRMRVIHRDLKASNILLDENMNPKISDFGTARIFNPNEMEGVTNRLVGTYGYMSPEYAMEGNFSAKSDVFSFGVLILEIVSGRKNTKFCHFDGRRLNLIGYAWELWKEGTALELKDPTMGDDSCDRNKLLRIIHVGLLCVQEGATDRPTMSDVTSMLGNDNMALPAPKQPAFFTGRNVLNTAASNTNNSKDCSVNGLTISVMEAR